MHKPSLTETFEGMCPYYMAIGMSYQEYWFASPDLVRAYRDAHVYKRKMENERLYLQGLYNYQAFSSVINQFGYAMGGRKGTKPKGYLEKPIDIGLKTESEKEQERRVEAKREREKAIMSLNNWKKAWEMRYGNH